MPRRSTMLKVEIDVMKQARLREATEFARRYRCPALVVAPDLIPGTLSADPIFARGFSRDTMIRKESFLGTGVIPARNADVFCLCLTFRRMRRNDHGKSHSSENQAHFHRSLLCLPRKDSAPLCGCRSFGASLHVLRAHPCGPLKIHGWI